AGAVAERMKLTVYLAYSFLVSALIYPVFGHWIWGGGWLAALPFGGGAKDFAGSGVVHVVGGLVALVGAAMVGPRAGKYDRDGSPRAIPGHNMTYVVVGTLFLFFGWFGFNAGSTMAAGDLRISVIAVNTFLAGATGAVTGLYLSLFRTGKADITLACNGSLAGLVGVTAPSAFIAPWAAVVVGGIGALVMAWSLGFVERVLKVDDAVGAVSVHAAGGIWGLIAVGIFADGTYQGVKGMILGDYAQLIAQLITVAAVMAWALLTGFLLFTILKRTMGLRVSHEEELSGLDLSEHGISAYPAEQSIPL
ncbi:MAG: ammonium transporter, partial [Firmicutes bacterium]|nr:ammonium transporter [Bacillota bacterium]